MVSDAAMEVRSAWEAEERSCGTIAAACARQSLAVVNHLVVIGSGAFSSAFLGGP